MTQPSTSESEFQPQRVIDDLRELKELTGDASGAQRIAWSEPWRKARHWFTKKLQNLPVEIEVDEAGNQWAVLRGKSGRSLVIGSHLDSVPNGGWLDGCLGVAAGIEVLRRLSSRGKPPVTVKVASWTDEEGRFGVSLFGSSAASGRLNMAGLVDRIDRDGIKLADALTANGIILENVPLAQRMLENVAAYLELHIEQGPVLESLNLPLAAVTGTRGVERHLVRFTGQAAHSGSTPMEMRRDALGAGARLSLAVREIAVRHGGVGTVGSLVTRPGIPTSVVALCEMSVEFRHLDPSEPQSMLDEARRSAYEAAQVEHVEMEWTPVYHLEPAQFHPELVDLCAQSIVEAGVMVHHMPSGPLHDAVEMCHAGIPTAMLFVQSLRGLSHTIEEDTRPEHLLLAVGVFNRMVDRTIGWISRGG